MAELLVLFAYYGLLMIVGVYSLHRFHLVRLRRRYAARQPAPSQKNASMPAVLVQLPVFNEPNVVARLVGAAAALRYEGDLHIQLLDDSDDQHAEAGRIAVEAARARGVSIDHVRRASRSGYKAGALQYGLGLRPGAALVAIFDADFVPAPDFLERTVPHFADAGVGMVQARWEHLNREESLLTRVQAVYLDAHFAIESAARHLSGRFFNFNGTAGVWRREAIEDGGGWRADTLTEDLDLSYRAQLAGWRFVFLPAVTVAAELPASLNGFHEQQHRWAKGSIQTARKVLPELMRSKLPVATKFEAAMHLTNNSSYLLTLLLALLIVPAIGVRLRYPWAWTIVFDLIPLTLFTCSILMFYVEGQRVASGRRLPFREALAVLPFGVGLSVRNSAAVLEGLLRRGGEFRRTPKKGSAAAAPVERSPRIPVGELILTCYLGAAAVGFASVGEYLALPFLLLFLSGFASTSVICMIERWRWSATRI